MRDPIATADAPATPSDSVPPNAWSADRPGDHIGPYKLLDLLGEGGMGAVWAADQSEPVKRRVALKLIKAGMDTARVLARFEQERQALALMDHPNIAKVLDAGATAVGRPYFVMELVKGVPIVEFCDREKQTVRERLELMITVCRAVQHAHQKGIIHRDLKPRNVLVAFEDGRPAPKVIDFGLAKATAVRLTDRTLWTEVGALVGTLEYMAPEQAELNNLDIDTRADVYSLGVILYELLTGVPPFSRYEIDDGSAAEVLRYIREVVPPRPSTRVSESGNLPAVAAARQSQPKLLTRTLSGDLDWVVMKCLEKERARRYATANDLADDLRRFLDDQPVAAGPPSWRYRFSKFAKRNRGSVAAAGCLLLALAAGLAGTTWGLVEARRQRDAAAQAQQDAEAVLSFVIDHVFAAARPGGQDGGLGHAITLRDALAAALPHIDERLKQHPVVQARLRMTLGASLAYLGDPAAAARQFEAARALMARHRGPDHPDTMASMNNLADALTKSGRHAEALRLHEETLALLKARLGPTHADTLGSRNNLANALTASGRHAEALTLQEETLAILRSQLGPEHPDTLRSMNNLADSLSNNGRNAEALRLNEQTYSLMRTALGPDHPDTLRSRHNLAQCLTFLGRHDEALGLHEGSLARLKVALGPHHPDTLGGMNNLAACLAATGRHDQALKLNEETLELRRAHTGADHPDTLRSMSNVANSLTALGRHDQALDLHDKTLALRRSILRPDHPDTLRSMNNVALSLVAVGRPAEALPVLEELLAAVKRSVRAGHPAVAATLYDIACVHARLIPQTADASKQAECAVGWLRKAAAEGFADVAVIRTDPDLDALRDREDFQKLIAELEAKARAKPGDKQP